MSTITNQTLTLTITSGTVETVIRKDNCRIDTFGDYVRLTDYTGERYEFLYSDVSSPSSTSATDLAETLEGYLNTGGGGGGGGVESVTGNLVDNTDPANPVIKPLSNPTATTAPTVNDDGSDGYTVGSTWFDTTTGTLYVCSDSTNGAAVWVAFERKGYKELVMLYTSTDGTDNGTLTILKQDAGFGTITAARTDNQVSISSSSTPFTDSKTFGLAKFVGDDNERVLNYVDQYADSQITFNIFDVDGNPFTGQLGTGAPLNCKMEVKVYP